MNNQPEQEIKVIDALNEKPKFWIVPQDLLVPWGIIFAVVYVITTMFLDLDLVWSTGLGLWLCASWWMLAGTKSYEFTDKFFPLPGKAYFNLNSCFVPATDIGSFRRKMTQRIKPEFRTVSGKKEKIMPFQIESNIHGIMRIRFEEDEFSLILRCDKENKWSATIPFALEGIHPEKSHQDIYQQSQSISEAIKDIPAGENLTFMIGCRSRTRKRTEQIRQLARKNTIPVINLILESDKLRAKNITKQGFRQEWEQYAFVSWNRDKQDLRLKNDIVGRFTNEIGNIFNSQANKFSGMQDSYMRDIYIKLAKDIYENCYYPWKLTLGTKAGINFKPLSAEQVWEDLLWYRFNQAEAPKPPQLIDVHQNGRNFEHKVYVNNPQSQKDIVSTLIEGERGRSNCPQHHSHRNLVEANGELVGVMTLEKAPESWQTAKDQIRWSWEKISDLSVRDTEIFLQIAGGDKKKARSDLIKISKQSTASNIHAMEKGEGLDVGATLKQGEAIEAQKRLQQGAEPVFTAFTMLIYRQNSEDLTRACGRMSNAFGNAKLIREENVCWKLWSETSLLNNKRQLVSTRLFTERRITLDSISVRGLLPISKPKSIHEDGSELVSREGGYPIHINLFKDNERAIITGTAGSGKSVLAAEFVKDALARGIKVIGMDKSNAGQSSFEPITKLLGEKGAYINIVHCSFNLLQPPDLSSFSEKEIEKRSAIWKNSLRSVLVSLAMGQIEDQELLERVDSIILKLMDSFFKTPNIVDRFDDAFEYGWKSSQWQNMPVLKDFLFMCSKEKLGIYNCGPIDERAINQIVNQIGAKLIDPNIGDAIGKPSNVPPNPDMMFFALSGLTNENNSYIMSLVAQMACLNVALENPKSLMIMDECSALFANRGFAEIVGERFATGRKEGQSVIILAQDPESIFNCSANSKIEQNTNYWLIGKTSSTSAKTYIEKLHIPPEIIHRNAKETYRANRQYKYSHWLVRRDDIYWDTLYFPSLISLAALVNGPEEKAARKRVIDQYPKTELGIMEGLGEFSYQLNKAFATGSPLSEIGIEHNDNYIEVEVKKESVA